MIDYWNLSTLSQVLPVQKYEINFVDFLTNKKADFSGRFLQDIWNYSDIEIEHTHDFIQILFPLNEESSAVFNGVFLEMS